MNAVPAIKSNGTFSIATQLSEQDMADLCAATRDAIQRGGGGFGWIKVPAPEKLESFWRGLLMVPGRHLFLARLDGVVAGALQLHEAPRNLESQAMVGKLQSGFTATWARGHGLGQGLMRFAMDQARSLGLETLKLDVRASQESALRLYRGLGFTEWGVMPRYAKVEGQWVEGHYFFIDL